MATGPDYAYTPGGRLQTRTWARTGSGGRIVTTYTYGFDSDGIADNQHGELVGIAYSNDPVNTPGVTYTYDRVGRRKTATRNGMTTTLSYPDTQLQSSEAHAGGTLAGRTVTTTYDSFLRPTQLSLNTSTAITRTFGYDDASRLKTVTAGTASATYGYLANSLHVEHIWFKSGTTLRLTTTKQHDFINRLSSISSGNSVAAPASFAYKYNNANQRERVDLADGSHWNYGYDELGQVTSGKRRWTTDNALVPGQQFEYTFDDIGNRTESKAGGDSAGGSLRTTSYTPNPLNQYTARTIPGGFDVIGIATDGATVSVNSSSSGVYRRGDYFQKTLTVDNSGNAVWQDVTVSSSTGGSLSPGSKFIAKAAEAPQHDLDGNLERDGRWVYTWDAENRLVKMESHADAPSASKRRLEFEYDHQSRRIRKTVETWSGSSYGALVETRYIYDGWNLIAELNANLTPRCSFVWGLDLSGSFQGAGGVGGLLFVHEHTGSATHAVAHDGNGNVAALFNMANGSNSARYEYGPFGEVIRASGTMAKLNPFHFSTKYEDGESGDLYYGYRFYNAETGRWLNRDPIEEQGGDNLVAFSGNAATAQVDPLGQWHEDIHQLATRSWSVRSGIRDEYAVIISDADIRVDSIWFGNSFLPLIGEQSRHLKYTINGQDSRDYHYNSELQKAIVTLKRGDTTRSLMESTRNGVGSMHYAFDADKGQIARRCRT